MKQWINTLMMAVRLLYLPRSWNWLMIITVDLRLVKKCFTRPVRMAIYTKITSGSSLLLFWLIHMGVTSSALHRNAELHTHTRTHTHTHANTHSHSKLQTPQSMALYIQAIMSPGHKAEHYSFETWSTTRPLNPWTLTYIPLIISTDHKTSCPYLFI